MLVGSVFGGLLLLIGATIWVVWFSSLLAVTQVEVTGASLLPVDEVTAAAQVKPGTPLVSVDLAEVMTRVDSLGPVESVETSRVFPHTLLIEVTERQVVFAKQTDKGYSWVDREGIEFRVTPDVPKNVPVVILGDAETRLLKDVATVVSHLPEALDKNTVRIPSPTVDRILLELPGGKKVIWGSADDAELKSQVLAALLGVDAQIYDVSAPNYPATR